MKRGDTARRDKATAERREKERSQEESSGVISTLQEACGRNSKVTGGPVPVRISRGDQREEGAAAEDDGEDKKYIKRGGRE